MQAARGSVCTLSPSIRQPIKQTNINNDINAVLKLTWQLHKIYTVACT